MINNQTTYIIIIYTHYLNIWTYDKATNAVIETGITIFLEGI